MGAGIASNDVRWEGVGSREDLEAAGRVVGRARGWSVVVVLLDGAVHALENRCSHATAALDTGVLRGCELICPLHGARFDVRDGTCVGPPATQPVRSFPARLNGEVVEVALPEKPALAKPKFGVFN